MATLHSDALNIQIAGGYRPSANEEFMNDEQLAYFRVKLLAWKESIVKESRETMAALANGPIQEADLTDRHRARRTGASISAPATGNAS